MATMLKLNFIAKQR